MIRRNLLFYPVSFLLLFQAFVASAMFDDPFAVNVSFNEGQTGKLLNVVLLIPDGHYLYADELSVDLQGGLLIPVLIPEPEQNRDPFSGELAALYSRDLTLKYRVEEEGGGARFVTVSYMGCNQEICFMPQSRRFAVYQTGHVIEVAEEANVMPPETGLDENLFGDFRMIGRESGFLSAVDFLSFLQNVEAGRGMNQGRIERLIAVHGMWLGILAILLGGLALNLTPCVLPMIPVNIAIIGAGTKAGSRRRGFLLGAVYGAGIAFVYGFLGVFVVFTGAQFGTLNASPVFNVVIAIVFLFLALSMFGVFNLDLTKFQNAMGDGHENRSAWWTAFFFGAVAALLAGACVAPVVISVLVISTEFYQRGNDMALLLPFVLGLGMALPWPFAGAGLSFLPKPGSWMERVKMLFGVVILITAIYYAHLGISLWRALPTGHEEVTPDVFWKHSVPEVVSESRTTGKPVFIDFWATWCKNCLAMDATTFRDPSVREALEPYVRLKYQAEDLSAAEVRKILDAFGIRGLPSYVVLSPQ